MGQIDKKLKNELFKVAVDYIYKEHLVGSQGELAEKIGISASALSRIMGDKKFVGDDTLRKMNEAFGNRFNMAYFRGEDPHCMLANTIHQSSEDAGFGSISLQADYGSHQLYFVASRGTTPTISATAITWTKPSDTFWGSLALDVALGMSVTQSVALARVATRLRIAVTDEVPATLSQFSITPDHWYYGLDYTTGEPVSDQQTARTIEVPSSYIGTTGQLAMNIYGLCPATDYTTDVAVSALTQDGSPLATLTLSDVPLRRNRVTSYSGQLLGHAGMLTVSLNDAWEDDLTVSW